MKIVVINGSPRGMKGNTARLLDEVLAGLDQGIETELVDLSKRKVFPCLGCDHCHKTGNCPLKDDYEAIKKSLRECDGFILASPNYIFSVTAQLKALFDRSGNILHCLLLDGKYGAVVETSGGGEDDDIIRYMVRFINSTGAQSVGGIGSPMAGERVFPDEAALFAKARELGRNLCRSIAEKREYPEQADYRTAFKARMKYLVEYRKEEWPTEHRYWRENLLG
ncbi:MAG: flavodoxin family protein [Trichloromonas sp.]|jgi:multimeric flavodoxin WrbA|nr:flavodoxin family protein [Trichloromonas sp.]